MQKGVQPLLKSVAAGIVDEQRGHHSTHVFAYDGKPLTRIGTQLGTLQWRKVPSGLFCPTFRRRNETLKKRVATNAARPVTLFRTFAVE